jgi:hypothetical protein
MPLDQLTGLLARWHATDGRVAQARLLREAAATLRELTADERAELAAAMRATGLDELADHLGQPGVGRWPDEAARWLLMLDTDAVLDVLGQLEHPSPPPPPPPPGAAGHEVAEPSADDPPPDLPSVVETDTTAPADDADGDRLDADGDRLDAEDADGDRLDADATAGDRADGALALLRELPAGWRRRRTADRLARRGALDAVDAATVLSLFDRAGDRSAIAARLLERDALDASELGRWLPPAAVRRLTGRRARR